jgi:uncharacterized protein (DUF4415 family)
MKPDPELIDEENPEWTDEMLTGAKPATEVLAEIFGPEDAAELLKPKTCRGAQKSSRKMLTTIRLDADILEAFKASGPGWQTRINEALREHLKRKEAA